MAEWFAMGGKGGYVWAAYGVTLVVLLLNWWWSCVQLNDVRLKTKRLAKPQTSTRDAVTTHSEET